MPYENTPTENAPALRAQQPADFAYTLDLMRADVDDMDLFDSEAGKGTKAMLDFLDRVVTDVKLRGDSLGAGVRGKGIPLPFLRDLMTQVGDALKESQNAKN
jgi:hypothetical protein